MNKLNENEKKDLKSLKNVKIPVYFAIIFHLIMGAYLLFAANQAISEVIVAQKDSIVLTKYEALELINTVSYPSIVLTLMPIIYLLLIIIFTRKFKNIIYKLVEEGE